MSIVIKIIKKNKLLVFVALIYIIISIIAPDKGLEAIKNSGYYLFEMLTVMPVVFLLTVLIDAWIPQDMIVRRLGEKSGILGGIFSLILGSLSAGPIYAAFPICKLLLKKGASIASIIIILSSWAVIKVPMLANEAKFLGIKFMAVRWVLTVGAIFIMAWLSSLILRKKDIHDDEARENKTPLSIKTDYCIGCGICARRLPEHFMMSDKKAVIRSEQVSEKDAETIKEICEKCPAKVIEYNKVD